MVPWYMGVSENSGTLFGALIVRILLFGGAILGFPIFGNPLFCHVKSSSSGYVLLIPF